MRGTLLFTGYEHQYAIVTAYVYFSVIVVLISLLFNIYPENIFPKGLKLKTLRGSKIIWECFQTHW